MVSCSRIEILGTGLFDETPSSTVRCEKSTQERREVGLEIIDFINSFTRSLSLLESAFRSESIKIGSFTFFYSFTELERFWN